MSGAVADPLGPIDEFAEQVMVPMADGIRLATDVYLPRGGRGADRLPCILVRLPYDKSAPFAFMPRLAAWFTERGYAFAAQDVRGRARSEGETFAFVHEVSDGSATLDWIVDQPWSNGVVGMFGDSYYGWTQWAAVASGHDALRAIVPRVTSVEVGTDWRETGGVFNAYQMIEWAAGTWSGTENFECDLDWSVRPLADVQADAHGGRRSRSLDHWISVAGDDPWWWEALYAGRGDPRARLRVPALHTGGWWDVFRRGQIRDFHAVHGRVPDQHLVMEATDHFDDWLRDRDAPPFMDFIDDAAEMERWLPAYAGPATAFFDRYLRGKDGDGQIPEVRWFCAHDGWREAATWPPPQARVMRLSLTAAASAAGDGGGLAPRRDRGASWSRWTHDPANPVPDGIEDAWRSLVSLPDERDVEARPDVLTFTGDPVDADLDLAGPVVASLRASSTAPSTHAVAKLVDVAPDGLAQRIVEGIVAVPRTGSRDEASDAVVDLGSTGYRVREGHRLRLEVATSCFPRFAVHPGTGENPMLAVGGSPSDQGLLVGGAEGSAVSVTVI